MTKAEEFEAVLRGAQETQSIMEVTRNAMIAGWVIANYALIARALRTQDILDPSFFPVVHGHQSDAP
jgi:hypothetical protein